MSLDLQISIDVSVTDRAANTLSISCSLLVLFWANFAFEDCILPKQYFYFEIIDDFDKN